MFSHQILSCSISPNCDKIKKVWNVNEGNCILTLKKHTSIVRHTVSPNWNMWRCGVAAFLVLEITFNLDHRTRHWYCGMHRIYLDQQIKPLKFGNWNQEILFSHWKDIKKRYVMTVCSDDNSLRVWDSHTGRCISVLNGHGGRVC